MHDLSVAVVAPGVKRAFQQIAVNLAAVAHMGAQVLAIGVDDPHLAILAPPHGQIAGEVAQRLHLAAALHAIAVRYEPLEPILDEFGAFPAVADRELRRYLPFLATTKVLIAAVKNGVGRETAHEAIKEHAVAVALEMREKGTKPTLQGGFGYLRGPDGAMTITGMVWEATTIG